MLKNILTHPFTSIAPALCVAASIAFQSASAGPAPDGGSDDDQDQVLLSFSTVGDSRQDPVSPDPTTVPVSGQDSLWLENTKALWRILRSVEAQQSHLLFFNGDMIMGYGNAIVPANPTNVSNIVNSDLVNFYKQYAFWRGMVAGTMESG